MKASQKLHGIMRDHGQEKKCSRSEMDATKLQVEEDADNIGSNPLDPAASSTTKWSPWNSESLQAI